MVANAPRGVVAKTAVTVVANDDDDDEEDQAVTLNKPNTAARIEVRKRKRKKGYVYVIGWRWQVKDSTGEPRRTASGGYKRGFSYVKTVETKRQADRIRKAAT